jgi:hypothetical protein
VTETANTYGGKDLVYVSPGDEVTRVTVILSEP